MRREEAQRQAQVASVRFCILVDFLLHILFPIAPLLSQHLLLIHHSLPGQGCRR